MCPDIVDIPDSTTTIKGKVELATDGETTASVVVQGNDARLAAVANKAPNSEAFVTIGNTANLTVERALTQSDGITLTDNGANSTATLAYNPVDFTQKHIVIYEELEKDIANTANLYETSVSGTGAAVTGTLDARFCGVPRLVTGSTTTGRAGLMFNTTTKFISFIFGQGQVTGTTACKISTASVAAQEFILRLGFIDTLSADVVDGVYFEYDRLSSLNWRMCTANNSVRTKTNSSRAVDTQDIGGDVRFKIVVNAAGTSAEYFINDTSIGTVTTNIPTTTGGTRDTSFGGSIIKSAGTTAKDVYIYFMIVDFKLTTTR